MFARHTFAVLALRIGLLAGMWVASAGAHAASTLAADSSNASAKVDIQVVIPAIMRILEDNHPALLAPPDEQQGNRPSEQRIVMLSTLRKGFCLAMTLGTRQVASWQMQLKASPHARMETTAGGYRLCVSRAGRHEIALSHDFGLGGQPAGATPLDWPVYLSLSAP